jgi:hypothetical protein
MRKRIIIAILSLFVLIEIVIIILLLNITPMKLKHNVFIYQYGETISQNIEDYVIVNSSIKEHIHLNLDNVENAVGSYQASISYYDSIYSFEIRIVDTIKPKAILKRNEWSVLVNKELYAKDLVSDIVDQSQTKVYFEGNEEYIKYSQVGSYIKRIIVEDEQGNQSAPLRVKINVIEHDNIPYFEGINNATVKKGESFDLYKDVKAFDDEDGNITSYIETKGDIDYSKEGQYTITYIVEDSFGHKITKERIITVE